MPRPKNYHKLSITSGSKSSRFVVDLKEKILEQELLSNQSESKVKKIKNSLSDFADLELKDQVKLLRSKLDFNILKKSGEPAQTVSLISRTAEDSKQRRDDKENLQFIPLADDINQRDNTRQKITGDLPVFSESNSRPGPDSNLKNKNIIDLLAMAKQFYEDRSNQLAIVSLAVFLYFTAKKITKWCYKIFYGTGWATLYAVRFIYFSFKKSSSAIGGMINRLYALLSFSAKNQLGIPINPSVETSQIQEKKSRVKNPEAFFKYLVRRIKPNPRLSYFKPVIFFALIMIALIIPLKAYTYYKSLENIRGRVLGASEAAVNNLTGAAKSAFNLNFDRAGNDFSQADHNFLNAQNQLDEINGLIFALAGLAPNKDLRLAAMAKNIVQIGKLSSELGGNISSMMSAIVDSKQKDLNEILNQVNQYGAPAADKLNQIAVLINNVSSQDLPADYQPQFNLLKQKIQLLNSGLSQLMEIKDDLSAFLGFNQDKRYLFVFQNNAELRASGGFIGSYALIDLHNGKIRSIEAPGGGSYDTEAGLLVKVTSPEPLQLVNPLWHFWDANWWPDWPTTAKKLEWFYEKSDGPTVDGVIGMTPTVMENLLRVIGPVDMREKYGAVINADNFWEVTQKFSEQQPSETKQPKKIIGDLMNKIIEVLPERLNRQTIVGLIKVMTTSLDNKDMLLYFNDSGLESKLSSFGWDGSIKTTNQDYLDVVNTNIAGGKSDKKIRQTIDHQAEVMEDGTIIDTLTVKREHTAVKNEPFSGVRNVDWMRIYVPLGSELLAASGFKPVNKIFFKQPDNNWLPDEDVLRSEGGAQTDQLTGLKIYNEFNKTVFANWSQVDPGQTAEIYLKYKLPYKYSFGRVGQKQDNNKIIDQAASLLNQPAKNLFPYSLMLEKQPGAAASAVKTSFKLNNKLKIIWKYPETNQANTSGWQISDSLDQDKFWAVLFVEN